MRLIIFFCCHDNVRQQHGFFHGGVVGTLADNCAGYAAFTLMPETSTVLAVEYKLNLMNPAKGVCVRGLFCLCLAMFLLSCDNSCRQKLFI